MDVLDGPGAQGLLKAWARFSLLTALFFFYNNNNKKERKKTRPNLTP